MRKNFYKGLVIIPFGATAFTLILVGFLSGFGYVLDHWFEFLVLFFVLVVFVTFFGILFSWQLKNFLLTIVAFLNVHKSKNIFYLATFFVINSFFIIFYPPDFLSEFKPFQDDLLITLAVLFSWTFFPLVVRRSFFKENPFLYFVSIIVFIITSLSFIFLLIINALSLFQWLIV